MQYDIRHARPEDADQLHTILTSDHVVRGTMRLPYMAEKTTHDRLLPAQNRLQLVAVNGDAVLGFAELLTNFDTPRAAHSAELNMIAVHQAHARNGIARALAEVIISMCDTHLGIRRLSLIVWTSNTIALRLYEDLGFNREGVLRDYVRSGRGFEDAILMARIADRA